MVPPTTSVEKTPTVVERGAMVPENETVGRLAELSTLEPAGTLVMMGGGIFMLLGAKTGNALATRVIPPCGAPSVCLRLAPFAEIGPADAKGRARRRRLGRSISDGFEGF